MGPGRLIEVMYTSCNSSLPSQNLDKTLWCKGRRLRLALEYSKWQSEEKMDHLRLSAANRA